VLLLVILQNISGNVSLSLGNVC
jgi:hypothetical protein